MLLDQEGVSNVEQIAPSQLVKLCTTIIQRRGQFFPYEEEEEEKCNKLEEQVKNINLLILTTARRNKRSSLCQSPLLVYLKAMEWSYFMYQEDWTEEACSTNYR